MMTGRGGTTREASRACTEQMLARELREGDLVVLDNLPARKGPEVHAIIEGKGAKVFVLPPCSPDLNPIELERAWVKWWLKTCRARTEEAINTAFCLAKERFTSELASGFIRHCGFAPQPQ